MSVFGKLCKVLFVFLGLGIIVGGVAGYFIFQHFSGTPVVMVDSIPESVGLITNILSKDINGTGVLHYLESLPKDSTVIKLLGAYGVCQAMRG